MHLLFTFSKAPFLASVHGRHKVQSKIEYPHVLLCLEEFTVFEQYQRTVFLEGVLCLKAWLVHLQFKNKEP